MSSSTKNSKTTDVVETTSSKKHIDDTPVEKKDVVMEGDVTASSVDNNPNTPTAEPKPWFFAELRNTAKTIAAKQYDALKLKAQEKGSELLNQAKDKLSSKATEIGDTANAKLEEAKDNVIKKFKWLV